MLRWPANRRRLSPGYVVAAAMPRHHRFWPAPASLNWIAEGLHGHLVSPAADEDIGHSPARPYE